MGRKVASVPWYQPVAFRWAPHPARFTTEDTRLAARVRRDGRAIVTSGTFRRSALSRCDFFPPISRRARSENVDFRCNIAWLLMSEFPMWWIRSLLDNTSRFHAEQWVLGGACLVLVYFLYLVIFGPRE